MKFYRVHDSRDAGATDALFATKKEREKEIRETYGPDDAEYIVRSEIEMKGRLTKDMVCRVYSLALR